MPSSTTPDLFSSTPAVLKYTPIVIKFGAWVLNEDSTELPAEELTRYRLRISPPRTNRKGEDQYIADSKVIEVPADGIIRLKLLPSDRYLPKGRYQVEYYREHCSTPVDIQQWVVPSLPPVNTYSFIMTQFDPVLPLRVWQVLSVSPGDNWVAEYNNLSWRVVRPPEETEITITYTPAATLDQLINYNLTDELNQIDRIRR
jgi:hypothetical protein